MFGVGKAWGTSPEIFQTPEFCLFGFWQGKKSKTTTITKIDVSSLMTAPPIAVRMQILKSAFLNLTASDAVGGGGLGGVGEKINL